jgi:hypothetical protein
MIYRTVFHIWFLMPPDCVNYFCRRFVPSFPRDKNHTPSNLGNVTAVVQYWLLACWKWSRQSALNILWCVLLVRWPTGITHSFNTQQEICLHLTMVGHEHEECSQLAGHKNKHALIHRNELCITYHSCALIAKTVYVNIWLTTCWPPPD